MDIKNKNIIITGGTDGIGLEVVKKLKALEANVIVIGRNPENIKNLDVKFYPCDLRDGQQISKTISTILTDYPNISALINNAGIWQKKDSVENIDDQVIDDVISTDLTAVIKVTKRLIPSLKTQEESAIINVSSRSGVVAGPGQSVYCAAKFGVYGFTETLKIDLKETSIKVAGVYQGGINTKMFAKAGDVDVPYQTFTDPVDLAEVIVFLLTQPKNIWISDIRIER
jgi:NAD(P)-dependent dehydrogenase (short-subunit alcohol dehydrogenase family)